MEHYFNSTYDGDLDHLIANSQAKLVEFFTEMDKLKKNIIEVKAQCSYIKSEIDSLDENDLKLGDLKKSLDSCTGELAQLQQRNEAVKADILAEHNVFAALTAQRMHIDLIHKS